MPPEPDRPAADDATSTPAGDDGEALSYERIEAMPKDSQQREATAENVRARLYERELEHRRAELDATRRSQIGSGERAEKIRTYNYPENRLTDHRIKLTVHQLDRILQGELDDFTEALATDDRRRALESV